MKTFFSNLKSFIFFFRHLFFFPSEGLFLGPKGLPQGSGGRSQPGVFRACDVTGHACQTTIDTPHHICKTTKHNTQNHNKLNAKPHTTIYKYFTTAITLLLCLSSHILLTSCSSTSRRHDLILQVLTNQETLLTKVQVEGNDLEITQRIQKDPILRVREAHLKQALKSMTESVTAIKKVFKNQNEKGVENGK